MKNKPTIEDIERILNGEEVDLEILPSGEIRERRKGVTAGLLDELRGSPPTPFSY